MHRHKNGWRIEWRDPRTGERKTKKYADRTAAERFEMELKLGIADTTPNESTSPTLRVYAERWLKEHCEATKSETQWAGDRRTLELHVLPDLGNVKLVNLRRQHLVVLRTSLKSKARLRCGEGKLSTRSVNAALTLTKTVMQGAFNHGLVSANPFLGVKGLKSNVSAFDYWTVAERDQVLNRLPPQEFVNLIAVAVHTGLRLGELAGLRRRDCDFDRNKIMVARSFNLKLGKELATTKGGTAQEVPMNAAVKAALTAVRFKAQTELVFSRHMFSNYRRKFRDICKAAGVRAIRFHDLRHTFASHLAMQGVDLMTIQKLMRHKSYQMTLRYAHLSPDHLLGTTEVLCHPPTHFPHATNKKRKSGAVRRI